MEIPPTASLSTSLLSSSEKILEWIGYGFQVSVVGFGDECGLEWHTNAQTLKFVFKRDMNWGGLLFLIIRPPCHPLHTPFGLFKICPCRSLHRRKYCFLRCVAGNVSREQTVTLLAARAAIAEARCTDFPGTLGQIHSLATPRKAVLPKTVRASPLTKAAHTASSQVLFPALCRWKRLQK